MRSSAAPPTSCDGAHRAGAGRGAGLCSSGRSASLARAIGTARPRKRRRERVPQRGRSSATSPAPRAAGSESSVATMKRSSSGAASIAHAGFLRRLARTSGTSVTPFHRAGKPRRAGARTPRARRQPRGCARRPLPRLGGRARCARSSRSTSSRVHVRWVRSSGTTLIVRHGGAEDRSNRASRRPASRLVDQQRRECMPQVVGRAPSTSDRVVHPLAPVRRSPARSR